MVPAAIVRSANVAASPSPSSARAAAASRTRHVQLPRFTLPRPTPTRAVRMRTVFGKSVNPVPDGVGREERKREERGWVVDGVNSDTWHDRHARTARSSSFGRFCRIVADVGISKYCVVGDRPRRKVHVSLLNPGWSRLERGYLIRALPAEYAAAQSAMMTPSPDLERQATSLASLRGRVGDPDGGSV